MFFGQEVKSSNQNKASSTTLESDVRLSQAVLDPASTKADKSKPVCLMAEVEGKTFILAVLDPNRTWQCPLDLMLAAGTNVKFFLRGQGTVHLTGYELREDMGDDLEMDMSSDDEKFEDSESSQDESASPKRKHRSEGPQTNGFTDSSKKPSKLQLSSDKITNGKGGESDSDSDDDDFSIHESDDDLSSSDSDTSSVIDDGDFDMDDDDDDDVEVDEEEDDDDDEEDD